MVKSASICLLVLSFVACSGAPAPTRAESEAYSVISEQADRPGGDLVIDIRLAGRPAQAEVKSIAESIIATRRGDYRGVTVRAFLSAAAPGQLPYAVSRLEGGQVAHSFNSPPAETQRIPTH